MTVRPVFFKTQTVPKVDLCMKPLLSGLVFGLAFTTPVLAQDDPLPSWNDGDTKTSIIAFVEGVTTEGSATFVD